MGRAGRSRCYQWMSRARAGRDNPPLRRMSALWSRFGQGLGDASQRRHKATRTRQRSSPTSHPCPRRALSEWWRVGGVRAPRDNTSLVRDAPRGRESRQVRPDNPGGCRRRRWALGLCGNSQHLPTGAATSRGGLGSIQASLHPSLFTNICPVSGSSSLFWSTCQSIMRLWQLGLIFQ